jgi:hypothetical protein
LADKPRCLINYSITLTDYRGLIKQLYRPSSIGYSI